MQSARTITLEVTLPPGVADRWDTLPTEDRSRYATAAAGIAADALAFAIGEPDDETTDVIAAVEEGLADMEAGRTFSLEAEMARWQEQKASLLAGRGLGTS